MEKIILDVQRIYNLVYLIFTARAQTAAVTIANRWVVFAGGETFVRQSPYPVDVIDVFDVSPVPSFQQLYSDGDRDRDRVTGQDLDGGDAVLPDWPLKKNEEGVRNRDWHRY